MPRSVGNDVSILKPKILIIMATDFDFVQNALQKSPKHTCSALATAIHPNAYQLACEMIGITLTEILQAADPKGHL